MSKFFLTDNPDTDWVNLPVIDIDAVWPDLLPKLKADEIFCDLIAEVASEITGREIETAEVWQKGLFPLSRGDGWVTEADDRFNAWIDDEANAGDPDWVAARAARDALFACDDFENPQQELWDALYVFEERFYPQPHEAGFLRPRGYCHMVVGMAARAAQLQHPDHTVVIVEGELHSTVVLPGLGIWDWLHAVWKDDDLHPITFTMAAPGWDTDEEKWVTEKAFLAIDVETRMAIVPGIAAKHGLGTHSDGRFIDTDVLKEPARRAAMEEVIATARRRKS